MAQKQGAEIYFGDPARIPIIRLPHLGKKVKRHCQNAGARHGMRLISAIASRGHMRFMIKQEGGVNAAVFIAFLQRPIASARRAIFLIVDRAQAHVARKTRAFVESPNGSLWLFYLPTQASYDRPCAGCKTARPKSAPSTKNLLSDAPAACRSIYL
ncbi:MAG: transposase [Methylocella sp.]